MAIITGKNVKFSKKLSYADKEKIRDKGLEFIVKAIIELEETGDLKTFKLIFNENGIRLKRHEFSSVTEVTIRQTVLEVEWMSDIITMKRATSEEDYFQKMCAGEDVLDEEYEKAIKILVDLHTTSIYKKYAVGGFVEGVYDNQQNDQ